jgi:hypothetical protein
MLLLTTSSLPDGLFIKQAFSIVLVQETFGVPSRRKPSDVSLKMDLRFYKADSVEELTRIKLEEHQKQYQDVFNSLASQAPQEANAIIGIQIATSILNSSEETCLILTAIGTPIVYDETELRGHAAKAKKT